MNASFDWRSRMRGFSIPARKRVEDGTGDDTEMYEGELEAAIEHASNGSKGK